MAIASLIALCLTVAAVSAGNLPFATLNNACSPNQQCIGGAVCTQNVCQCPPVYEPSGNACVYAAPAPLAAPLVQPAPALPVSYYTAAQAPIPAAIRPVRPAVPYVQAAPYAQAAAYPYVAAPKVAAPAYVPAAQPAYLPAAQPAAAPWAYAPYNNAAHLPVAAPVGPAYAWPGSQCSSGKVCVGNSFCQQGTCGCQNNYVLVGQSCIEAPVAQYAPAPFIPQPVAPAVAYPQYANQYANQYIRPAVAPVVAAPSRPVYPQYQVPSVAAAPVAWQGQPCVEVNCQQVAAPSYAGAYPNYANGLPVNGGLAQLLANPYAAPFPFPYAPFAANKKN